MFNSIKLYSARLLRRIYSSSCLVFFRIDEKEVTSNAEVFDQIIKVTTPKDLTDLNLIENDLYYRVSRELNAGKRAYIIIEARQILHASCASEGRVFVGEIGLHIETAPMTYIYNCMTDVKHRGKGYYYKTLKKIASESREAGIIITCLANNQSSMSVIKKLHPVELGRVQSDQFLGFRKRVAEEAVRCFLCK